MQPATNTPDHSLTDGEVIASLFGCDEPEQQIGFGKNDCLPCLPLHLTPEEELAAGYDLGDYHIVGGFAFDSEGWPTCSRQDAESEHARRTLEDEQDAARDRGMGALTRRAFGRRWLSRSIARIDAARRAEEAAQARAALAQFNEPDAAAAVAPRARIVAALHGALARRIAWVADADIARTSVVQSDAVATSSDEEIGSEIDPAAAAITDSPPPPRVHGRLIAATTLTPRILAQRPITSPHARATTLLT